MTIISVDYARSLREAMTAAGCDSSVGLGLEDYNELKMPSLAVGGTQMLEIAVADFSEPVNTEKVLGEIFRCKMRPADLRELLAYKAQVAGFSWRRPCLVALGSPVQKRNGLTFVPYVTARSSLVGWLMSGDPWPEKYGFLAVKNASVAS